MNVSVPTLLPYKCYFFPLLALIISWKECISFIFVPFTDNTIDGGFMPAFSAGEFGDIPPIKTPFGMRTS